MGVVTDDNGEPYVTLFDKSFMGLVSGTNCDESDLACQFCPEKSFVKTKTKRTNPIPGFETALASDMALYRKSCLEGLLSNRDDERESEL